MASGSRQAVEEEKWSNKPERTDQTRPKGEAADARKSDPLVEGRSGLSGTTGGTKNESLERIWRGDRKEEQAKAGLRWKRQTDTHTHTHTHTHTQREREREMDR